MPKPEQEPKGLLFKGEGVVVEGQPGSHLEFGFGYGLVTVRNCFSSTAELIQTQRDIMTLYLGHEVFGDQERLERCRKLVEEARSVLDQPINSDGKTIRQLLEGREKECVDKGIEAGARILQKPGDADRDDQISQTVLAAREQVEEIVLTAER